MKQFIPKLAAESRIYIKYFAYFANNLFLHIVIRLFIFGFHHFEI
ncbi:hypothetical protein AB8Q98_19540 [Klebsiella pneumoniae]